jgi:hypothetical protein
MNDMSHPHVSAQGVLADEILDRIERLLLEAERTARPLELEPYRGSLFELFVLADGAGYLEEDAERDLTSDAVSKELAARWGLSDAARHSVAQQTKLEAEHLAKMRLLWSFLRMWMEWTYAWQRWSEFHGDEAS